jgi:hypothetical protein
MSSPWSEPLPYDLSRTPRRGSVPAQHGHVVPETPGTYVIYRASGANPGDAIVDIGEAGPRSDSKPHGLRGRLASSVAHSASERIAADLALGAHATGLCVVWIRTQSKEEAKHLQDGLLTLFRQQWGHQPPYNRKLEYCEQPQLFQQVYLDLMAHVASLLRGQATR